MNFKQFYQLYTEGASPVLFHHTYTDKLVKILNSKKFELSFSLSSRPDRKELKDPAFYMSFSRIRWSGYNYGSSSGSVIIEVDGSKLNQRYKVEPIDYWQYKFGTSLENPGADEQEDRLMYNKSSIPALPYIKNVSIYIKEPDARTSFIISKCKELNIPCYVYNNKTAFKLGDTRRTIDVESSNEYPEENEYPLSERTINSLLGIKKIIQNPLLENDVDVDEVYKRMGYMDWKESFSADFHNIKTNLNPKIKQFLEWVAYIEKKTNKSIFDLLKSAADKRYEKENIQFQIQSLKGLIRFIREGSAPGWASLTRENIQYYIRKTEKYKNVDDALETASKLSKTTDISDEKGWNKIADKLENVIELLGEKIPN